MTARSPAAVVATTAIAVLILAAAVRLQATRERVYPEVAGGGDVSLYMRSGATLRRVAGAYRLLAADVYWIRAIQYYGGIKRGFDRDRVVAPAAAAPDGYPLLYPLLDITTTLDPRFNIAYRFGAVFLGEAYPRGANRPDLAIALLEKGLREQPGKWEYMQDIGFVHYWFRHDYLAAGEWFNKAADVPGAPWWLRSLAATTVAQGGDRQSSKAMWEAIRASAEIDWLRADADRRLRQLQALDVIDALQRAADDYARRTGQTPDFPALVRGRVLRGFPLDSAGTPFEMSNGRVLLSPSSPLWPLPEEPGSGRPPS